jgi:hypothetical protein
MHKTLIPAFLLVLGSVILGATVLREPIAHAASPFTNVIIGNTNSNPVPVSGEVGITGTPAVKSGDVATVIAQGGNVTVGPGSKLVLDPDPGEQDVSRYREVTLYWEYTGGSLPDMQFAALTSDGTPYLFAFDDFAAQDLRVVRTYDPAPATLVLEFHNKSSTATASFDYTLIGRTN